MSEQVPFELSVRQLKAVTALYGALTARPPRPENDRLPIHKVANRIGGKGIRRIRCESTNQESQIRPTMGAHDYPSFDARTVYSFTVHFGDSDSIDVEVHMLCWDISGGTSRLLEEERGWSVARIQFLPRGATLELFNDLPQVIQSEDTYKGRTLITWK